MSLKSFLSAVLAASCLAVSFAQNLGTGAVVVGDPANQNFLNFTITNSNLNLYQDSSDSDWSVEQTGLGEFTLTGEHQDTVDIQIQNANEYTQQELVDLLNSETNSVDNEDGLGDDVADVIGYTVLTNRGQDLALSLDVNNEEEIVTTKIYDNAEYLVAVVETQYVYISPSNPGGPLLPPTPNV